MKKMYEIPQKNKFTSTLWFSFSLLAVNLKEMKSTPTRETCVATLQNEVGAHQPSD